MGLIMMLKHEFDIARTLIENAMRKHLGARGTVAIATIAILVTAGAVARPGVEVATSWISSLWLWRINEATRYIEQIGSQHFLVEKFNPGDARSRIIISQQQVINFSPQSCLLRIETTTKAQTGRDNPKVTKDYDAETILKLGSMIAIEISNAVKSKHYVHTNSVQWTPNAYHVYISNKQHNSVRESLKKTRNQDALYDYGSWIATFHVLSVDPITKFVDYLLYLDRWCGNTKAASKYIEESHSR